MIYRPPSNDRKCFAKSKRSGCRCGNWTIKNKRVCYFHGGCSTGARTPQGKAKAKMNSLKSAKFTADKQLIRKEIVRSLRAYLNEQPGASDRFVKLLEDEKSANLLNVSQLCRPQQKENRRLRKLQEQRLAIEFRRFLRKNALVKAH